MQLRKNGRDVRYQQENDAFTTHTTAAEQSAHDAPALRAPLESGAAPASEPTPAVSVIDRHASFDGRFESEHDLRIEGFLSGEVTCRGTLTVDREATAKVRAHAREGRIFGRFDGEIVCTGRLIIGASATVTGTLKAAALSVEEGATINAQIDTSPAQPAAVPGETARETRETREGVVTRPRPAPAARNDAELGRTPTRPTRPRELALVGERDDEDEPQA